MKIKQAMRYQLHEMVRSTLIYFLVIILLYVAVTLLSFIITGDLDMGNVSTGGSTFIFLFVLGLSMFKNPFKLMLQNGISRRTQVISYALSALAIALLIAVVESLLPLVFGRVNYNNTFGQIYIATGFSVRSFVWNLTSNFALLTAGFCITTLYYRMNKALKVSVSIGVPVLLFVVLPLLEVFIADFRLLTWLLETITWLLGIDMRTGAFYPWRAIGSFSVFSVVMMGCSYLLARRATLKEG